MKKKFVALIPAKNFSSGVPKKNFLKINQIETIAISINAAKKCEKIDEVFVSTDSKKILEISKKYGAKVIQRPEFLCRDHIQLEDVILHAIKSKINDLYQDFNLVLLQPTSILRDKHDILKAINKFNKKKYDSLFSAVNLHPLFWEEKKGQLNPINYKFRSRLNRQKMSNFLIENGSIYIFKKNIIEKKKNRLGGNIGHYIMKNYSIHEIDEYQDLELMKAIYNKKNKKKLNFV